MTDGFKPVRKRRTGLTKKRIRQLERRIKYLEDRIAEYEFEDPENYADYDREELSALRWALKIVRRWVSEDPLFTYEWSGAEFTERASTDDVVSLLGTVAHYGDQRVEIVGAYPVADSDPRTVRLTLRPLDKGDTSRPVVLTATPHELKPAQNSPHET